MGMISKLFEPKERDLVRIICDYAMRYGTDYSENSDLINNNSHKFDLYELMVYFYTLVIINKKSENCKSFNKDRFNKDFDRTAWAIVNYLQGSDYSTVYEATTKRIGSYINLLYLEAGNKVDELLNYITALMTEDHSKNRLSDIEYTSSGISRLPLSVISMSFIKISLGHFIKDNLSSFYHEIDDWFAKH